MNVRIEERPTFKVVGVKEEISLKDGANLWEIPKFWERVNLDGTANKISDLSHGELGGLVGRGTRGWIIGLGLQQQKRLP